MRSNAKRLLRLLALPLTLVLVLSRFARLPPLVDAATGDFLADAWLDFPVFHLLLTPFSSLADLLSCNSARQDFAFLGVFFAAYALWRLFAVSGRRSALAEAKAFLLATAALACFLSWTVFFPRAPARLSSSRLDAVVLDFHSHTSYSWDGNRRFTPARNADWHERAGYMGGFITDHNLTRGAEEAKALGRARWLLGDRRYSALLGEEASLHDAHVLVLGNDRPIAVKSYADDLEGIRRFLADADALYGGLAVMSLPEYWRHHWGERLERFPAWGAKGYEIVSCAPKALDFPAEKRRQVVALCRERNLFMTGGTDNHGYGSAPCAWNIMKIARWEQMDPDLRQKAVIEGLGRGFSAVQVVTRTRTEPAAGALIALDLPRALWTLLRTYTWGQCAAALTWIWLPLFLI